MKIAIVTDIHHGPASHTKLAGWDALAVLDDFVAFATEQGADLILDLGDHISDTDLEQDRRVAAEVAACLAKFPGPRVHLLGNHDVEQLSIADNEAIFGQSMASRVVDLGGIRLIAWQPDVTMTRGTGFAPTGSHLDWLVAALEADERPAIIATHLPFSGNAQIGNHYFEHNAEFSRHPDHAEVRAAVERTGRAALWLSGHVHWTTIATVQGIVHVSLHSLSERFTTFPLPACAFALLDIADGTLTLDVRGNEPLFVRLPFRASSERRWLLPMGPFWPTEPTQPSA
ncbi:MAG: hypothetical protein JWR75_25 [Devosia sp.]|nr:hypothetical protein [Devosia sp.]